MSYLENIEINIAEPARPGAINRNLLLLDIHTSSDAEVKSYTKGSTLSGSDISTGMQAALEAIFAEGSGVSTVYTWRAVDSSDGLAKLPGILAKYGIWAVVLIKTFGATQLLAKLGDIGMILSPKTGDSYVQPTQKSARLAYYCTKTVPAVAVVASLALADRPYRTWANRLMRFRPSENTATDLATYKSHNVNAFYVEGNNFYSGTGRTSVGGYIDNEYAKDYIKATIRNAVKKVLFQQPKYDFEGIGMMEAALMDKLQALGAEGLIEQVGDDAYNYTVTVPSRTAQTDANKQERKLWMNAMINLAGTIENVTLNINIVEA